MGLRIMDFFSFQSHNYRVVSETMVETVLSSEITRSQHEEVEVAYENGEHSYTFFFSVNHIHHSITLKLVTRRKNVKMLFVGFYCHSPQLAALAISYVCHTFFISHTGHRKLA